MIYLGDKKIGKVYLGDKKLKKIYLGDKLIWELNSTHNQTEPSTHNQTEPKDGLITR